MREKIIAFYNGTNAFGRFMGMELIKVEPGDIEYSMELTEDHLATPTFAHGGSLSALMDGILGVAALSAVAEEGKMVATIEFKINYLAPAEVGQKVIGAGKVLHKGSRLLVTEGKITDSKGVVVASATGTFRAYDIERTPFHEEILATPV